MNKFGQYAKAIAFAKLPLWVKNYNSQNRAKNYSRTTLELLCAKKELSKTHILFEQKFLTLKVNIFKFGSPQNAQFCNFLKLASDIFNTHGQNIIFPKQIL